MSEINRQELEEMQSEAIGVTSRPQDNILKSFNVLEDDASTILTKLKAVVKEDISKYISTTHDIRSFSSIFKEQTSSFESRHEFSASVGVKGKYGVFSASAKVKGEKVDTSSHRTLFSTYAGELNMGNVALRGVTTAKIIDLLDPEMANQLKAISNLAEAENFTKTWGTHLVERVKLGGVVFVSNSVETQSSESKQKLAIEIDAAYGTAATLQSAINMSEEIKQSTKKITQKRQQLGGDVHLAQLIDVKKPETINAWAESVTTETTYAISDSIEIFTLVNGTPREILKKYIDLTLLAASLENPVILADGRDCIPFNTTLVVTGLPEKLPRGFKIIGGGAQVTSRSNNFLMGSFPQASEGDLVTAWNATSHDLAAPSVTGDVITSYAIAIHDPEDYIAIIVTEGKGSKKGTGDDNAVATLPNGWVLTCGGVSSSTKQDFHKFITASYFKDRQTWVVASHDYKYAASNVELKAYAIGIKSMDPLLTITASNQVGPEVFGQNIQGTIGGDGAICGGGVRVSDNIGAGNLVQQSSPIAGNVWGASSKDLDGNISKANIQAYAISLRPVIEM